MDVQESRAKPTIGAEGESANDPEGRSWLRERFRRVDHDLKTFAGNDDPAREMLVTQRRGDESGAGQSMGTWFRLLLAMICLGAAIYLTGARFAHYAINHVWTQARNSPMALIVPVLAVEFLWIIAHVHTGGFLSRLKIGLGAIALCMAFFAPSPEALADVSGRGLDWRQVCAFALAAWVFTDGWRDRRLNLDRAQRHDLASQGP